MGFVVGGGMKPALLNVVGSAHAMSQAPIVPGVQEFSGDFRLNGIPARRGDRVKPGDIATTGSNSSAVIVIGQHAFMLRANSTIEFYPVYFEKEGVVSGVLKVGTGAMLAVFGKTTDTKITTSAVTIGIRGTGCYVDSLPDRTYACVCYSRADLISTPSGTKLETIITTHHDEPRYVYPPGGEKLITGAPVIDHGDAELILLEALLHRRPPFYDPNNYDDRY